jgi:ATP-dependent Clp protease ATP-binding subunit ClpA
VGNQERHTVSRNAVIIMTSNTRGTDRMKDVAARADEEHMSRGRMTGRSLYPAG